LPAASCGLMAPERRDVSPEPSLFMGEASGTKASLKWFREGGSRTDAKSLSPVVGPTVRGDADRPESGRVTG
jgi:hypothetical protein